MRFTNRISPLRAGVPDGLSIRTFVNVEITRFKSGVSMKRLAILAVLITLQSAGQGKWSEKARLPEARGELGVASVNGKIYVLGGSALEVDAQTLNEEYDPATDKWT